VIEAADIDRRRRLVLIRRDNTEHLMMIGGPTDVVIEGDIVRASPARVVQGPHPATAGGEALPLDESPTGPLQGEPALAPGSRWEPSPRPSEHILQANPPSRSQQAPSPSLPDQQEAAMNEALERLAKQMGRMPQPDAVSEPRERADAGSTRKE
jgi:flagellar protein FliO/FliZ